MFAPAGPAGSRESGLGWVWWEGVLLEGMNFWKASKLEEGPVSFPGQDSCCLSIKYARLIFQADQQKLGLLFDFTVYG